MNLGAFFPLSAMIISALSWGIVPWADSSVHLFGWGTKNNFLGNKLPSLDLDEMGCTNIINVIFILKLQPLWTK